MTKAVLKCSNFSLGCSEGDEKTIPPFQLATSCTSIHENKLRRGVEKDNTGVTRLTGRPLLVLKPWPKRLSFQFSKMSIPPYTLPTVNFPGPVSSGGGTRRSTIGGVPEKEKLIFE